MEGKASAHSAVSDPWPLLNKYKTGSNSRPRKCSKFGIAGRPLGPTDNFQDSRELLRPFVQRCHCSLNSIRSLLKMFRCLF